MFTFVGYNEHLIDRGSAIETRADKHIQHRIRCSLGSFKSIIVLKTEQTLVESSIRAMNQHSFLMITRFTFSQVKMNTKTEKFPFFASISRIITILSFRQFHLVEGVKRLTNSKLQVKQKPKIDSAKLNLSPKSVKSLAHLIHSISLLMLSV